MFGVRALSSTPAPHGAIRVVLSAITHRYEDEPDQFTRAFKIGFAVDYLWRWSPQFGSGGGLGLGADYDVADAGRGSDLGSWGTVRLSVLVVRLAHGRFEVGLHGQVIRAGDEWQRQALVAGDVLVW